MFAASKTASGSSIVANYIEEVFSTYLYTGTGTPFDIVNNIDLSTKGGLVWGKSRDALGNHNLIDTVRGVSRSINTNRTNAQDYAVDAYVSAFNTNGFTIGNGAGLNSADIKFAAWTFRKQPKFFDVQTWTGTGANTTISHALGSVPACIIVKRTDVASAWQVYHSSLANTQYMVLNTTAAVATGATRWNSTTPTSTVFSIGTDTTVNASGGTYVAYIFASNAGGFGLTGTDNVISCGSVTNTSQQVDLGYEPQWILYKTSGTTGNWNIFDNMRGMTADGSGAYLPANLSNAEATASGQPAPNATGFYWYAGTGSNVIYIAIRRGPMKVPSLGTSVFSPIAYVGANGAAQNISAGFPVDMDIIKIRNDATRNPLNHSRLMGGVFLATNTTGAQQSYSDNIVSFNNAQNVIGLPVTGGGTNEINGASTSTYIAWTFKRAPSFMDVVCYTGVDTYPSYRTISHNLTVVPELAIVKQRNGTQDGAVVCAYGLLTYQNLRIFSPTGNSSAQNRNDGSGNNYGIQLNLSTATTISIGYGYEANQATYNYVAYLFATCAGVSKVGSYTGTGATQTISCGFTGGARFVLVKRTDTTGDWYVWDTARGMVSGTDPSLLLNSTAAEVNANSIYTTTGGFQIVSTAAGINDSGGTYIFLAIA
jgi:hypothetical protein